MSGPVIADTDLLIDFLRGEGAGVDAIRCRLQDGTLRFTAVTAFELRVGADFLRRELTIARLLAGRTLPLDIEAALHAGAIAADLGARGEPIGVADTLQAGIARRFGLPFATRNTRLFARVPGLRVEAVGH